jgi:hypothetical protein
VVAVLAFAAPLIGDAGSYGSGALYVSYTFSSLFLGPAIVHRVKNKYTMISGLALYTLYILAYPFAAIDDRFALPLVLTGGFAGGIAAGFIWTAQGAYFAQTSRLYAKLSGIPQEESSNKLSGMFAAWYLILEVLVKVAASVLLDSDVRYADIVVFFFFSAGSILSVMLMTAVKDIEDLDMKMNRDAAKDVGTRGETGRADLMNSVSIVKDSNGINNADTASSLLVVQNAEETAAHSASFSSSSGKKVDPVFVKSCIVHPTPTFHFFIGATYWSKSCIPPPCFPFFHWCKLKYTHDIHETREDIQKQGRTSEALLHHILIYLHRLQTH